MSFFAKPKIACTGFQFLEGPVWVDESSPLLAATGARSGALIFSDIPASRLCWLADGRTGIVREPSGKSNGNALEPSGMLVSCEHENRCISRFEGRDAAQLLVDRYDGKRLNSPNDVAVRSDGLIFFTDPPYGVAEEDRELEFQGVFCVESGSPDPMLLNDRFDKPNGLALSPDEATLYVADTERGHLRRFSVGPDGTLSDDRKFCDCERPDGVCVDTAGNVWVACMDGVEIFSAGGQRVGSIPLPERPANIAFGDSDGSTLYICARTSIYSVETRATGALARRGRSAPEACCS
jgi:gluconolactonase